jgi:hypothetical protein
MSCDGIHRWLESCSRNTAFLDGNLVHFHINATMPDQYIHGVLFSPAESAIRTNNNITAMAASNAPPNTAAERPQHHDAECANEELAATQRTCSLSNGFPDRRPLRTRISWRC